MNTSPIEPAIDVVIIGLGPTGMTLAHLLGKRGLNVTVLERDLEYYGRARAVYTDDECLRVFQAAGIANELQVDMNVDGLAQWILPSGKVLAQLGSQARPYGWPFANFLFQPWLETKMEDLLKVYPNVTRRRGRNVTEFAQDETGVTVEHSATEGGDEQNLKARFLVACDGGRSLVRQNLGIKMQGKSFPEPWLVVDLKVEDPDQTLRHLPYFSFLCDPHQPVVMCPQPGGHYRFEFLLMDGATAEDMERPETVKRLVSQYIDFDKVTVLRSLVYTFNALIANSWQDRRVFLAGDAAHMTPQFLGQGMSSGIRDANNLAWKLDLAVRNQAGMKLLQSYHPERAPHAQAMIDMSVLMKDFVSMSNPALCSLRNLSIRTVNMIPWLNQTLREGEIKPKPIMKPGSYIGLPRRGWRSAAGRLAPQPQMRDFHGRRLLLDDFLSQDFVMIGLGLDPRDHLSDQNRVVWERIGIEFAVVWGNGKRPQSLFRPKETQRTPPILELEDLSGAFLHWARRHRAPRNAIMILRPDRMVAGLVSQTELDTASATLFEQMGVPDIPHD